MKVSKSRVSCLLVGVLCSIVAVAPAQNSRPAAASAAIPDTPVGKLGGMLIAAINSGNAKNQVEFVKANFAEEALRERTAEAVAGNMQALYSQTGGFDVVEVVPVTGAGELRLKVRSKRGNHWAVIGTRLSREDPSKLDGWGIRAALSPEDEKASRFPETRMTEGEVVKEIERHVELAALHDRFSGAVLVAKQDRVIFDKAYGKAEQNFCAPNTVDTKFNLGSMNKMFTSIAIAQLVQAGKLSYEDTLAKVLPSYPNQQVAGKVTIEQLLTHTSGLGDFFKPEFFQNREKYINPTDYFPIFANDPLRFEPGKGWSYSNAAFIVLGAIVEKLSGENYFDYVREHIYKPAGMKETDSYGRDEIVANLAYGYTRFGGIDPLGLEPRKINWMTLPVKGSSAGGGYSTVGDLLRFAQALRGYKLVSRELTERLVSAKVNTAFGPDLKYCYGFMEQKMADRIVRGHGGGAPGINSDLKIFWDGSYTVIVMGNYDPPAAQNLSEAIAEFLARQ
jgi:CubicO group peptidase (beta-lactamase class C family)